MIKTDTETAPPPEKIQPKMIPRKPFRWKNILRKFFEHLIGPYHWIFKIVVPVLCWEFSGKNFWLSYGPPNKNGTKKVAAARIKSTLSILAHIGKQVWL